MNEQHCSILTPLRLFCSAQLLCTLKARAALAERPAATAPCLAASAFASAEPGLLCREDGLGRVNVAKEIDSIGLLAVVSFVASVKEFDSWHPLASSQMNQVPTSSHPYKETTSNHPNHRKKNKFPPTNKKLS